MKYIPEKNTEEYGSYLDEIINELMGIKNSLKRWDNIVKLLTCNNKNALRAKPLKHF